MSSTEAPRGSEVNWSAKAKPAASTSTPNARSTSSLEGKYVQNEAREIPASAVMSSMLVPPKPRSRNSRRAVSRMLARVRSALGPSSGAGLRNTGAGGDDGRAGGGIARDVSEPSSLCGMRLQLCAKHELLDLSRAGAGEVTCDDAQLL